MKSAFPVVAIAVALSGCASTHLDRDRSLVAVEAVVVSYGEDHFIAHGEAFAVMIDQKIPAAYLEVRSPQGRFDRRLTVYSTTPLPDGNPLREVGAVVEFTTEKRFLVALLSDPTKPHDTAFLYVDSLIDLRRKEPNQSPSQHNSAEAIGK